MLMSNSYKDDCSFLSLGKLVPINIEDEEHSESLLKLKLSNKLYDNPVSEKLLKKHDG